ncbi:hypothetical protein DFH09DRAFT_1136276 [Mycena vulgaris]|nr:hypothetical protein DFH09DRAFT_1136276 [Mycena vulgaris]
MASAVRGACAWMVHPFLSPTPPYYAMSSGADIRFTDRPAARDGVAPLRVRRARAPLGRADWARHAAGELSLLLLLLLLFPLLFPFSHAADAVPRSATAPLGWRRTSSRGTSSDGTRSRGRGRWRRRTCSRRAGAGVFVWRAGRSSACAPALTPDDTRIQDAGRHSH